MIRIFKLVLLLVVSQVAFGQAPSNYTNINGRYRWIAGMFDSTFHIPKGTSPSLRTGGSTNAGGLFYNTSDSSVYTYTGTQWIKARGSINPSDTTNKYVTQVYKKNGSDSVFYVKGGNHLFAFVDSVGSPGGGGGGKIYYFNGGVSMGTIGGLQMYELGDTANTGAAANFTRSTTGNIANFITDSGKPGLVQIPAGVWSVDAWLSETGGGANHAEIWIEVEKWDGSTITTIATSPIEQITEGSTPNLYSWSVSIPTTSLTVTDRIIIQFYISNTNGKTVTLYTQNGYVGEVHTTFTTGIGAINGLTAPAQYLVTGTSGTDFNINSVTATHTFNLPTASATNRGALSSTDWTTFNSKLSPADTVSLSNRINLKLNISDTAAMLSPYARTNVVNAGLATKVNISDTATMLSPYARKNFLNAGTGISYSSTTGTIANTAPDQTVALNAGTGISISGTYPNFTITNSSPSSGGTVTSVGSNTGTGLTGGPITTSGTLAIDTTLISTRAWRQKGIDSVAALINNNISGTTNFIPRFSSANVIDNSIMRQSGTSIGINTSPSYTLDILETTSANIGAGTATNKIVITGNDNGGSIATTNTTYINFAPFQVEAMRITSGGVVNMGANFANNFNKLNVGGSATIGYTTNVVGPTDGLSVNGSVGIGLNGASTDSALSVLNGVRFQRGVRMSGLPTAPGTRALRVDANGTLSVSDTLTNGISGSGTTNYIPKFTSSSAIGNSLLREGTNSIGLGYTPSTWSYTGFQINGAALHGSPTETDAGLSANAYYNSGWKYYANNYASQYRQVNGEHEFNIAGIGTAGNSVSFSTAIKILTSGNVGIGTTSPTGKLHIVGNTASPQYRGFIYTNSSSATLTNESLFQAVTAGWSSNSPEFLFRDDRSDQETTQRIFEVQGARSGVGTILTTLANGNVGIGTTSPVTNLDVNAAISGAYTTSSSQAVARLYNITNAGGINSSVISFQASTDDGSSNPVARIGVVGESAGSNNGAMVMMTRDASGVTERMRITSGGTLQLNAQSTYGSMTYEPSLTYTKAGQTGVGGIYFGNSYNSNNNIGMQLRVSNDGTQVQAVTITSGGNVGIGTTNPGNKLSVYANNPTTGILFEIYNNAASSHTGAIMKFTQDAVADWGIGQPAGANAFAFWSGTYPGNLGTERMRITSGGDVGINTQTPNATFHVNGSIAAAISIKTATYTLTSSDYTVVFDLNGNATANLPNATTCSGRIYVIKINRTNVSDVLTIDPNGAQTIDGNATYDLQCQQAITIQSDGSNWRIIGDYAAGVNCL